MNWNSFLNPERLRASTRPVDFRNEFESDYGRVLFSPALRRMHDKTQVFPLTADDNIHSRLTHSMEVMAIGYSLGMNILKDDSFISSTGFEKPVLERIIPIILQSSCLVHDIGNPPFGHFGETVIKSYFKKFFKQSGTFGLSKAEQEDFEYFDGNAQGLRILTKLQVLHDPYGLNLTYATLASYIKYPNDGEPNKSKLKNHKRGVFQSEKNYFEKIAAACKLVKGGEFLRHPLAFLMEAADSICYLIMDIEDGFNKGWYKFRDIKDYFQQVDCIREFVLELDDKYPGAEFEITKMVNFRIKIISILVNIATDNFLRHQQEIYQGSYNDELIFEKGNDLAAKLKQFFIDNIVSNREIISLEITGNSVLSGLLDHYITYLFHDEEKYRVKAQGMISHSIIRACLLENEVASFDELTNYFKFRVIVDYISGMTDQFALDHYQKISGQKII
ncbi:dGTP triphosphohydrolase [Pedobacter paludis]|uniref:dGTPase n=1 Tax=Pedobacter paludis TaxID=2203212 RepID=A0A317F5X9_9SPHI|nr:dNTP triphosphohydrolase [Pedobacter paludis]PWS33309.1 dGTPase [Pedobacter paludis]